MKVNSFKIVSLDPRHDFEEYLADQLKNRFNTTAYEYYTKELPVSEAEHRLGISCLEFWVPISLEIIPAEGTFIKHIPKNIYASLRIHYPETDFKANVLNSWYELYDLMIDSGLLCDPPESNRCKVEKCHMVEGVKYLDLYYPFTIPKL